jgi:acyl carrier protein
MVIVKAKSVGNNMTAPSAIRERVRAFVLEKFPLARKSSLKDTDGLLERGIVDSMGILDLVSFLEEEFSIQLSDEELLPENFQSVECIAAFMQQKLNSSPGKD